jgi:uncharacterized protein (DUF1499 family)
MKRLMKYGIFGIITLSTFFLLSLVYLSVQSRSIENYGMVEGKLSKCPDTPNCICTEEYVNKNYQPIQINLEYKRIAWDNLKSAIRDAGGDIQIEKKDYLWATFITPIFRFVDDFEARVDTVQSCIHLRSASRVGDYDFGTNLERVNLVVEIYKTIKSVDIE